MIDLNSIPVMCEYALIKHMESDLIIRDFLRHFTEDTGRALPSIVIGFRQGDEHPKGSGICEYIGEINIKDNIQKQGSDKDTLDLYVRHIHAFFLGINVRALRGTLSAYVNTATPAPVDGTFKVYGIKIIGDGDRTTVKTTRSHPFRLNLIVGITT